MHIRKSYGQSLTSDAFFSLFGGLSKYKIAARESYVIFSLPHISTVVLLTEIRRLHHLFLLSVFSLFFTLPPSIIECGTQNASKSYRTHDFRVHTLGVCDLAHFNLPLPSRCLLSAHAVDS